MRQERENQVIAVNYKVRFDVMSFDVTIFSWKNAERNVEGKKRRDREEGKEIDVEKFT